MLLINSWEVESNLMYEQKKQILNNTKEFVFLTLNNEKSGHDWFHIQRVVNLTKQIAQQEIGQVDAFICEMAALLHDIPDEKLNPTPEIGEQRVINWLESQSLAAVDQTAILQIVLNLSYKGGTNNVQLETIEGKIVQDADRLDAMGAIGIARTMIYSGNHGRPMHDPAKKPRTNLTLAEYRSNEDTAIMHFYEKLLKLKDTMNTTTGKKLANERHLFMEDYLKEFFAEWQGEK